MLDVAKIIPEIENICRDTSVQRLDLFGSVLTERYSSESDVDVLVAFDYDDKVDYFTEYFNLKDRLKSIFNREVDLVVDKPFRNPVFRETVEKTRTKIYER
jgi:predicted nucleotidyltransferase